MKDLNPDAKMNYIILNLLPNVLETSLMFSFL